MGSKAGIEKMLAYQREQFGSVKAYREHRKKMLSEAGTKGGKNGKTEGFAHGKISGTEAVNKRWLKVKEAVKTEITRLTIQDED